MTRDTRIGLLVGLLFILAFGLILSELTNPTPPESTVDNARGPDRDLATYEHARRARRAPVRIVERPAGVMRRVQPPARELTTGRDRDTRGEAERTLIARRDDGGRTVVRPRRPKTYTVRSGDNLRRIAAQMYGAGREDEYWRIFDANRDKLPDESTLAVGQVLVIPPLPSSGGTDEVRSDATVWQTEELTMDELEDRIGAATAAGSSRRHTVQAGDTLTSIARRLMGDDSPQAVQRLLHANRGWIADADHVPVGVELVIP